MNYKWKLIKLLQTNNEVKKQIGFFKKIEERHIRMFCEINKIWCKIHYDRYSFSSQWLKHWTNIDNTKSFNNQEDEVYKTIFILLHRFLKTK